MMTYPSNKLAQNLLTLLPQREIVVLCIGSDRVTGDCLGPLVGEKLKSKYNLPCFVYGTLQKPVNALNLVDTVKSIKLRHFGACIVAIDSSTGKKGDIGKINVFKGGIYPGASVGKKLPLVGDVSITATVAESIEGDLYNVRLGFVDELAGKIAAALSACVYHKGQNMLERASLCL